MKFKKIGYIRSEFKEPEDLDEMRKSVSSVIVDSKYAEGLYKIEENDLIKIIFYFHESEGYDLKGKRRKGRVKGVFASRNPRRPNPIGTTTVKLLERENNKLKVKGLDAIDGTPVLDIKPYSKKLDSYKNLNNESLKENPRKEIRELIKKDDLENLLIKAGQLHGHFCPFLCLGVKAGSYALNKLNKDSKGMEEVIAITETNSCLSDGIQYSTGCTFGNNSLIYRDFGKSAVTIAKREGKAIRFRVKDIDSLIEEKYPGTNDLFEKVIEKRKGDEKDRRKLNRLWREIAFDLIHEPIKKLFEFKEVEADIPDYAPIFETEVCENCGENVMAPKIVEENSKKLCIPCSGKRYRELNGEGLVYKK